jgi:hypothetical protein
MTTKKKSPIAQEMARMRWQNVSAEARTAHAKMAANARGAKFARERAETIERIPERIKNRLSDPPQGAYLRIRSRYAFYYTVGYELGLAQHERATRKRMIRAAQALLRTLEREQQRERVMLKILRLARQADLLKMTLTALQAPPLERLAVDRAKLATMWEASAATTSLRSVLTDASVLALVPSSFREALLDGLRAGALGEVMLIGFGAVALEERERGVRPLLQ